jgi:tellurite resistance protein
MTKQRIPSGTAVAELESDYFDQRTREVIQALLTAGALVALADGRVWAVEREEAVNYIDQQVLFPAVPRSKSQRPSIVKRGGSCTETAQTSS